MPRKSEAAPLGPWLDWWIAAAPAYGYRREPARKGCRLPARCACRMAGCVCVEVFDGIE